VDSRLLAFLAVATLLTITPGADMALVTRNVLRGGLGAGLRTSAGILTGLFVWALLSAIGVAAIVAASATAFTVLKLAGAAYLIYLGVSTLWHSRAAVHAAAAAAPAAPLRSLYRQGLLSNLTNPKVGIFYTSFLPQFVEPGRSVLLWTSWLAAIHIAMGVAWLAVFAWLVARAAHALSRPRVRRALDRVTGTVLVALGLRVASGAR
jgi:RhtB (resistance to homoserine/threonine) family protein